MNVPFILNHITIIKMKNLFNISLLVTFLYFVQHHQMNAQIISEPSTEKKEFSSLQEALEAPNLVYRLNLSNQNSICNFYLNGQSRVDDFYRAEYILSIDTINIDDTTNTGDTILACETNLTFPNVFSPNNDGTNDFLFVQGDDELVKVNSLTIYNRWGGLVFEAKDTEPNSPELGWDGFLDGQRAASGIYGWVTEVEFSDGSVQVIKGNTTLLW